MSFIFLNLALRFLLEIASLIAIGMWGYQQTGTGWLRWIYAIMLPMIFSTIWGVFNVPGDPSRSGQAPVPVPGIVRLVIEILFFAAGTYCLFAHGYNSFGGTFAIIVSIHYLVSYNRIIWLLSK